MYELNYEENRVGCIVRSFSSREEAAEIAASEIHNCKEYFGTYESSETDDRTEIRQVGGDGCAAWSIQRVA